MFDRPLFQVSVGALQQRENVHLREDLFELIETTGSSGTDAGDGDSQLVADFLIAGLILREVQKIDQIAATIRQLFESPFDRVLMFDGLNDVACLT